MPTPVDKGLFTQVRGRMILRTSALRRSRALVIAVDPLLGSHGARRSCGHPWPSTSAVCGPSPLGAPREYVPQFYAGVPLSWQTLLLWGGNRVNRVAGR